METLIRKTTSEKIKDALKDQGRSKKWLQAKLEISQPTLDGKLKSNSWKMSEIVFLQSILGID